MGAAAGVPEDTLLLLLEAAPRDHRVAHELGLFVELHHRGVGELVDLLAQRREVHAGCAFQAGPVEQRGARRRRIEDAVHIGAGDPAVGQQLQAERAAVEAMARVGGDDPARRR